MRRIAGISLCLALLSSSAFAASELPRALAPSIAAGPNGFLAAWLEDVPNSSNNTLRAAALGEEGTVVGNPIELANGRIEFVDVAFGGNGYAVAWTDLRYLYVQRFAEDGTKIGAAHMLDAADRFGLNPILTWRGDAFLVLGYLTPRYPADGALFTTVLGADGRFSEPKRVTPSPLSLGRPQIAWNGRMFLVITSGFLMSNPVGYYGPIGMALTRLDANGEAIGEPFYPGYSGGDRWRDSIHYSVASDGTDFMLAHDVLNGDAEATLVRTEGEQIEMTPVATLLPWFSTSYSSIRWDGSAYVASTQFGTRLHAGAKQLEDRWWMSVARLSADGGVLSRSSTQLGVKGTYYPALAARPDIWLAVAPEVDPVTGVPRVRIVSPADVLPSPVRPSAPRITALTIGAISWSSRFDPVEGFVVEDRDWPSAVFGRDVRSAAFPLRPDLRVRAFNAGGVSKPVADKFSAR
jgi:hypothetical protein